METWKIFSFHLPKDFSEEENPEPQVNCFVDMWWKTKEKNRKALMAEHDTGFS